MGETCDKKGWWTKYSSARLAELEKRIFSVLKSAYKTWHVPIGPVVGKEDKIWTIALNEDAKKTPLVLLHGFAASIGFWCMNLDDLAKDRPVYAIDLLGFGRSSRPQFAKECEQSEKQMVDSIEAWRKQLKLDQIILLGHSFGGYLAASYAIEHPDRVKHLILADPWGFAEKPTNYKPSTLFRVLRVIFYPLTFFNPLAIIRGAGPYGPWLVNKFRQDIPRRYEGVLDETGIVTEYIYQCNAQYPSGEAVFHSYSTDGVGWCKTPMMQRYDKYSSQVPITILYGEHSWIAKEPGVILQEQKADCYINIEIIPKSGHHIYSDQPKFFNKTVSEICRIADLNLDKDNSKVNRIDQLKEYSFYDSHKFDLALIEDKRRQLEGRLPENRENEEILEQVSNESVKSEVAMR